MITTPLILLLATAQADARRIGISVDVITEPGVRDQQAERALWENVARISGFAFGATVAPPAALSDKELRACASAVRCIAERLKSADIDLGIFVLVNRGVTPHIAATRFIDSERGAVIESALSEADREELPAEVMIANQVIGALPKIGLPLGGRIVVATSPGDAALAFPPGLRVEPREPRAFVVPTGAHEITATRDGYQTARATAVVTLAAETKVELTLQPESMFESSWFWIGVGAIAVAGSVAAYFAFRPGEGPYSICQTRDPAMCN